MDAQGGDPLPVSPASVNPQPSPRSAHFPEESRSGDKPPWSSMPVTTFASGNAPVPQRR